MFSSLLHLQYLRRKSLWQQFAQSAYLIVFRTFGHDNLKFLRMTKFCHYLSADAAGRAIVLDFSMFSADNGNGFKIPEAFADRLKNRRPFGTI